MQSNVQTAIVSTSFTFEKEDIEALDKVADIFSQFDFVYSEIDEFGDSCCIVEKEEDDKDVYGCDLIHDFYEFLMDLLSANEIIISRRT